jgi:hypothetical protein
MLFFLVTFAWFITMGIASKKEKDHPDGKDYAPAVVTIGVLALMLAWFLDLFIPGFWIGA